ncbi:fumarylacetoacetate hydrolase family protein [Ramlibacter sp. AW1]|uniref:Fumarylacetoacetate hydrolase family protein n=1 Tax=Ramlibacter aurantiacus TaxID=2801330 RepID=A0A936ZMC7_9BURK|nr:fumarylacetoacetate hydrolase family protein [Ramlibacter aurantiacus]MBL0419920.1 fumarylacetoacetate hydrolase family protein [Ramlibacter aurantiacus]
MPANHEPIDTVALALARAWRGGPPADDHALQGRVTSLAQAYAVQERLLAQLGVPPEGPMHWKSGGPSRSEPMRHAPLPPAGVRACGAGLEGLHLRHRWIEAEVALRIGRDVGAEEARSLTVQQAGALVDRMCVSIELVDSRWQSGRDAPALLKVADLLVHGALVLGEFVPYAPGNWAAQECRVRLGDAPPRVFTGSLGVGDPAWVLPDWMRHVTRDGAPVRQGTVVSTGTWCGLLEAQPGERVLVEFPGIGAASVQC